jgi:hypothetical protein
LQTVDPNNPTERVFYPDGAISTTPVIRMAYSITPGQIDAVVNQLPLGFFRVNARYSVRGRRGVQLTLEQRYALLSEGDKEKMYLWFLQQN